MVADATARSVDTLGTRTDINTRPIREVDRPVQTLTSFLAFPDLVDRSPLLAGWSRRCDGWATPQRPSGCSARPYAKWIGEENEWSYRAPMTLLPGEVPTDILARLASNSDPQQTRTNPQHDS